jgi:hypothetical protein
LHALREVPQIAGVSTQPRPNRQDYRLLRIEARFHGLIRWRVAEGRLEQPTEPPPLDLRMLDEEEQRWFPVPGMCGGFAYRLRRRGDGLVLVTESWSRVVDGSGQRHIVTSSGVVLEAEGFV